eukprot:13282-Heterococcus_DN1.PRE.1
MSNAGLRQVMITGDNVLTAVAVARDSGSSRSNMWDKSKPACFVDRDPDYSSSNGSTNGTAVTGSD